MLRFRGIVDLRFDEAPHHVFCAAVISFHDTVVDALLGLQEWCMRGASDHGMREVIAAAHSNLCAHEEADGGVLVPHVIDQHMKSKG